jgi:hypothetical protein
LALNMTKNPVDNNKMIKIREYITDILKTNPYI